MVQIIVAAIGAAGTAFSAVLVFMVARVHSTVNGRTTSLETENKRLRAINADLERKLHRRRRSDRKY